MNLKPWYRVVYPREDLCSGKPLDAAEFAVHLDQVRAGQAPEVYQDPQQFFERTYLTQSLSTLAVEVIRRLSGETTETSAVFNLATQFGGGKTHSLTLLYHLAQHGSAADRWPGVAGLLDKAKVSTMPQAKTAVFVGQKFDPRGGDDGTPLRKTPWGEIDRQ
jgi:predicted AAA+ superfamily ATPase